MKPEQLDTIRTQEETLQMIAVDMLTRIDCGPRMTSDGIARFMMDLVANYNYTQYDDVAKRVISVFIANPDNFCGDTPLRYHNLTLLWRERFPDSYEEHQQRLRAKREAELERDNEDKSVVAEMMDNLAQDLVNRDHFSLLGFEPTDGEGQ